MIQKIKRATLLTAQDMNHQAAFEIEKLPKIIVEQLEVESSTVTLDANFCDDLNTDELDGVELVRAVEEEFDIELPDDLLQSLATIQQAMDYLAPDFESNRGEEMPKL
jgi:acyl carrier protein